MKLRALAGILLCASVASGCDLSPQPLPPTGATVAGGSGTSSGSGATLGPPSSGSAASAGTGTSAGADAGAPSGAAMTANGSAEDAGLPLAIGEAGSSGPLDASLDSTSPPADAAFDSADAGDVLEDASEASDAASD